MNIAYVNCFAGLSGSALLGALVNSGIDQAILLNEIRNTVRSDYKLSFHEVSIRDVYVTRVVLELPDNEQAVPLVAFIRKTTESCASKEPVTGTLHTFFMKYAIALSKLHCLPIDTITMRKSEIMRIYIIATGFLTALKLLGVQKVVANPVILSSNTAADPISDSLVLEMARGLKVKPAGSADIINDPLGVALLAACVAEFGPLPEILVSEIGYGLLENDNKEMAALRIVRGVVQASEDAGCGENETVMVLETSIDDMNPELFPYLIERLLALGALDSFLIPIYMKKGRPANLLTVLCREETLERVLATIFSEATTLGVRIRKEERRVLKRKFFGVNTPYGMVTIKAGYLGQCENPVQLAPEFEDCKKLAEALNVPLKEVYAAAQRAVYEKK